MKDEDLRELTARIRQEMEEIQRVLGRMKEGWERARRSNDDYYIDGVALNLHGFYSGVERIFAQIAETIDGQVPRGENWHQVLLQQMMDEVAHVRPAVISTEIGKRLNEHRGFRHIVRNVYSYKLDAAKIGKLVLSAQDLFSQALLNRLARRFLIQRVSQKRRFSMNQRPTGLNVTKAITGFLQYKSAEGLSPVTVTGYDRDLKLWIEYQGDMDVAAVETTHILAYLNYLRTDYVPRRITDNNDKELSPKTVYWS